MLIKALQLHVFLYCQIVPSDLRFFCLFYILYPSLFIHVIPPSSSGRLQEMNDKIVKNSFKMYHFLTKIQNLPEMNQKFSYIFYTFFKNLPQMEEKSPSFHFQTHHMYDCCTIRKTCPCNVYPLEPHFYIVKLGVCRGISIFLIFAP